MSRFEIVVPRLSSSAPSPAPASASTGSLLKQKYPKKTYRSLETETLVEHLEKEFGEEAWREIQDVVERVLGKGASEEMEVDQDPGIATPSSPPSPPPPPPPSKLKLTIPSVVGQPSTSSLPSLPPVSTLSATATTVWSLFDQAILYTIARAYPSAGAERLVELARKVKPKWGHGKRDLEREVKGMEGWSVRVEMVRCVEAILSEPQAVSRTSDWTSTDDQTLLTLGAPLRYDYSRWITAIDFVRRSKSSWRERRAQECFLRWEELSSKEERKRLVEEARKQQVQVRGKSKQQCQARPKTPARPPPTPRKRLRDPSPPRVVDSPSSEPNKSSYLDDKWNERRRALGSFRIPLRPGEQRPPPRQRDTSAPTRKPRPPSQNPRPKLPSSSPLELNGSRPKTKRSKSPSRAKLPWTPQEVAALQASLEDEPELGWTRRSEKLGFGRSASALSNKAKDLGLIIQRAFSLLS
ncbi:hypothetical protein MNV49_003747 [Pseudohyphozyma bogoriensis]|nr:hypothetical protein MNV49_003747 [Pseudohyphozyma bogoriensis]